MNRTALINIARWTLIVSCVFSGGFLNSQCAIAPAPVHPVDGSYIKAWLVLGPFLSNEIKNDFLASAGGEAGINPKEGDTVARENGASLVWKRFEAAENFLNFMEAFGSVEQAVAYAYCDLETPSAGEIEIQMMAGSDVAIWVNGTSIEPNETRAPLTETAKFHVSLRPGKNRCLVKVLYSVGRWDFSLRTMPVSRAVMEGQVTDPAGTALGGALIQLFRGGTEILRTKSDKTGKYRLDIFPVTGLFDLRAAWNRLGTSRSDLKFAAGERPQMNLRLEDTLSISGAVLTMDGKTPQSAVQVQALLATNEKSGEHVAETVFTDEKGEYQFIALKPGRYRVRCQTQNGYVYYRDSAGAAATNWNGLTLRERPFRGIDLRVPQIKKGFWQTYSTFDGLPYQNVACIEQMTNGLIYLGFTFGGLCDFDGREFKSVENLDISGGTVNALVRDTDDSLWIGSGGEGLIHYDGTNHHNFSTADGLADNGIRSMLWDHDGILWIGTRSGLSKWDRKKFSNYRVENGLPSNWINDVCQARDGTIWIATSVSAAQFDGNKFVLVDPNPEFSERSVTRIRQTRDGAIWFATLHGAVRRQNGQNQRLTAQNGLANDHVNDILETSDGTLWFGTDRGLSRYNGKSFVTYTRADGLVHETVHGLNAGPDGILWIATRDGLSRFDPEGMIQWTEKDGLINRDGNLIGISSIKEFQPDEVWMASGEGVFQCDGFQINRVEALRGIGGVTDMCRAEDGTIWLAGLGLWKFDGGTPRKLFDARGVRRIETDARGNIWLGTDNGLLRYQPNTDEKRIFTEEDGLPDNNVFEVRRGQGDALWVGTYDGLCKYDGSRIFRQGQGTIHKEKLAVWTILAEPDETVWLGGSFIFGRFDGRAFSYLDEKLGVQRPRVWRLARSSDNVLWLATENVGLIGFDPAQNLTTAIDARDGLAGKNAKTTVVDSKGQVWVATNDGGLTRYRRGAHGPSVQLVSVETDDNSDTNPPPRLEVTASHRLTMTCREIDFKTHPQKRKFSYRIKSLDGRLITNVVSRERRFDWTPPKSMDCELQVQAIDRDLNFSTPARLSLHVISPWYKNAWIAGPTGASAISLVLWAFIARSLYMAKRREAERLQGQMLRQERQARETLQESNQRLEEAKLAAEEARVAAEEAKESAEMASRAKSSFLANMSHEIRTPLNAVLGYAQILQRDGNLSDKQRQAISTIERSGNHLLDLINEILDLSKIESGRMELSIVDFDLKELIQSTSVMFEPRCEQKGLEWRVEGLGSSPIPLRGDDGKLRQVLINLIGNAVKFTDHGTVKVLIEQREGDIFGFQVVDTGPGIALDMQQKILEPFTQGLEGKHKGGTGLGLAISRRQIELMGGELRLNSELGKGSRFYFPLYLPPATTEVMARSKPAEKKARRLKGTQKVKALVVDDIADNRNVLEDFLIDLGVDVTVSESGEDACEKLQSRRFDIAFLDIQMPGMTGTEVAERVLGKFGTGYVKLVAISASVLTHEQKRYAEDGFDAFVPKPFRFEQICDCLVELLGVKFDYETEHADVRAADKLGDLSPDSLPPDLAKRLRHAAEMYSVTEFESYLGELETIGDAGKTMANRLRELSRNVQIDEILNILGRTSSES